MTADRDPSSHSPCPPLLHSPQHRHFVNPAMLAANVMEIDVPPDLLAPLQALVPEVRRLDESGATAVIGDGLEVFVDKPPTWRSDIRWISHNDEACFAWFEDIFRKLDVARHVAPYVRHDRALVLYARFS